MRKLNVTPSSGRALAPLPRRLLHDVSVGPTNNVHGWIYDPDRPQERLGVRIVLQRRPDQPPLDVAVQQADGASPIIEPVTGSTLSCGFQCRLPLCGDAVKIRVFELTTNIELDGSPLHFGVAPRFEGYLDGVDNGRVSGWAWGAYPDYRCEIDVFIDRRYLATVFAVEPRGDLADARIGNGAYGFHCLIPLELFDGNEHEVSCFYHSTDRHLTHSPLSVKLSLFDVYAAIGSDKILRGVLKPNGAVDGEQLMLDLLVDDRPMSKLTARRLLSRGDEHAPGQRSYFLSAPAPPTTGVIEIALADNVIAPNARERYRIELMADTGPAQPALDCDHVDATEQERVARLQAAQQHQQRQSKLLVPVWGDAYIAVFCQLCLPSLLSDNNLPRYVKLHKLTVTILTRGADIPLFETFPAVERLRQLADVTFVPIDDILASFFDPEPQRIYSVALTYAFFRGIKSCGDQATLTDFIFWNADFLAGD